MIEARVNAPDDFTNQVKQFVIGKSSERKSVFSSQPGQHTKLDLTKRAKRSLTDWRQLYHHPRPAIGMNTQYHPKTAECRRCSMASQMTRRPKPHTADMTKTRRSSAQPLTQTRMLLDKSQSDLYRNSMLEFAITQNCYQKEMLGDTSLQTAKERRFYARRLKEGRTREHLKMARYVANMSLKQQPQEVDATASYLKVVGQGTKKVVPFQRVKIKAGSKLSNSFLAELRKKATSENGLRYYSRC